MQCDSEGFLLDIDGRPLRVYFGLPAQAPIAHGADDEPVVTSDEQAVACGFAGPDGVVYEACVRLANPMEVFYGDRGGSSWSDGRRINDEGEAEVHADWRLDAMIAAARRAGHDGVIARAVLHSGPFAEGPGELVSDLYVVFNADQLRLTWSAPVASRGPGMG